MSATNLADFATAVGVDIGALQGDAKAQALLQCEVLRRQEHMIGLLYWISLQTCKHPLPPDFDKSLLKKIGV